MAPGHLPDDRQTKTGARRVRVQFAEALEGRFLHAGGHPRAFVSNLDGDATRAHAAAARAHAYPAAAMLQCALEQIAHEVAKVVGVAADPDWFGRLDLQLTVGGAAMAAAQPCRAPALNESGYGSRQLSLECKEPSAAYSPGAVGNADIPTYGGFLPNEGFSAHHHPHGRHH